ncbi:MAG: hypothetical protein JWP97_5401 [Labilithrix sp.]|nr:hypothetical protein [Labilithrix sp.]
MSVTLEDVFTGAGLADLPASPLQLAVARAAEGEPIADELLTDEEVERYFGCGRSRLGLVTPVLVVIVAGVRAGKSFFAACGAIRDVLAADCSAMKPHEVARHAIVAPTTDNASATFKILLGIIESSRVLRRMVVGAPTSDTIEMRRPDGRVFEIVVVAASRGAVTLRSRWLAGFTLEEVAGFGIEGTGAAVNGEELLRGGETRLLPGTQGRIVSSPFGQQGILWSLYQEAFGKPGRTLVVHAPTRALNPSFPQATIDAVRARDPDGAAREYDAAWIDAVTVYFETVLVKAATRATPLERSPVEGSAYFAAWDAATRGNGWTLVVSRVSDRAQKRVEIALAREWRGSKATPLSPKTVIADAAKLLKPFGVTTVSVDQWSIDALRDTASEQGLSLVECGTADRDEAYAATQMLLSSSLLELPPLAMLAQDLRGVRKIITPRGVRIDLPRTADGRHCDFAPSLALAAWRAHQCANTSTAIAPPVRQVDPTNAPMGYGDAASVNVGPGRGSPVRDFLNSIGADPYRY